MITLDEAINKNNFTVLTCGGGLNFTALIYEWYKRKLKAPDLIIFADTGSERQRTYTHITSVNNWLLSIGWAQIITVNTQNTKGEQVKLNELCLKTNTLPPPAFGFKSCSLRFKVEQVDKFLNNNQASRGVWGKFNKLSEIKNKITRVVGFDAGEDHRVIDASCYKYDVVFPLVEWDIDRHECLEIVRESPLNVPIKSSCYMCPNMKSAEIFEMQKNDPESLRLALEIEDNYLKSEKAKGRKVDMDVLRRIDDKSIIGIVKDMKQAEVSYLLGLSASTGDDEGFDFGEYTHKAVAYISSEKMWQKSQVKGLGRNHSWREDLNNLGLNVGSDQPCVCSEY